MKNSNKILIGLLSFLLISMLLVDLALKKVYSKIDLNDALKNYEPVVIKSFKYLKVRGGNAFSIEITQADTFGMHVMSSRRSFLKTAYHDDTLLIEFAVPENSSIRNLEDLPKGILLYTPSMHEIFSNGTSIIIQKWNAEDLRFTQTRNAISSIKNLNAQHFTATGYQNSIFNFDSNVRAKNLTLNLKNNSFAYLKDISYLILKPELSDAAQLIFTAQSAAQLNDGTTDQEEM